MPRRISPVDTPTEPGDGPRVRAVVREVPASFSRALARQPVVIDVARAREQHAAYVETLRDLGVDVTVLPADEDLPDCCFVEDTAVVHFDSALITRPGHPARRAEVAAVAEVLQRWVGVARMTNGRLDGGDVLGVGAVMWVGRSERTDDLGAAAVRGGFPGCEVVEVPLRAGLHLKSGATALPDGRVLVSPDRVDPGVFDRVLLAPEAEAANVVVVGGTVVAAAGFPETVRALRREGYAVREVDNSELRKADSALTCLSILVPVSGPGWY
jgi:dimethylargininase